MHIHDLGVIAYEKHDIDLKNKQIVHKKCHVILTGHYLGYSHSYASAHGMPPSKVGSPIVKFFADSFDIQVMI